MYEDGRDVNAIRTRHAVFTVVAGNILQTHNALCYILVQEALLFLCQRYQRTVRQQVVLQVFHIGHAAEYGEYSLWCSCIAECP